MELEEIPEYLENREGRYVINSSKNSVTALEVFSSSESAFLNVRRNPDEYVIETDFTVSTDDSESFENLLVEQFQDLEMR